MNAVRDHFVYWMFDAEDRCLYVGMTRQPETRWYQHRQDKPGMVAQVAKRRMAGPFTIETARKLEREQQDDLIPLYDGHRSLGYKVVARPGVIERLRASHGFKNEAQLAKRMGMHHSQLSRVLRGAGAGTDFIASTLFIFGKDSFEEIFHIAPIHDRETA